MRRFILVLLFGFGIGSACEPSGPPIEPPSEPPSWVKEAQERSKANAEAPPPEPQVERVVDKPLLWSVKSSTGSKSYLLGTYHVGTDFQGLPALPESVRSAFEGSTVVVLEADAGAPVGPEVNQFIVLSGPKSLKSMIKADLWDILVEESGLPPQQLEKLQPHVATSTLVERWTPDRGVRGMDGRFVILARAHEKELKFLETAVQQLELLSKQVTVQMLVDMLEDVSGQRAQLQRMREAFAAGDATAIEQLSFEPAQVAAYPGFHEALFWGRNQSWLAPLKPLLDSGGAFVAVGAGHLVGPRSLVALLQEDGYEVVRVDP